MNSEELELSLRAEFDSYLKDNIAKMRGEVDEFQKQIEAEFEKYRSQVSDAFLSFSSRFDTLPELDGGFKETVIEHLRLARDEGAQITATAMAEAEDLERASAPAAVDLSEIKEALDDISGKDTQSAILKSLITHAAKYTPRGAFFIIKNDHFAGWKVFGKEAGDGESAIREIHFPLTSDSILSSSVRSLNTVEGSFGMHADDSNFLEPLNFGQPDRMYAIPLVARGRGVAVLYCDYGHEGVTVNTDALEMLVKVAGLTVELLASTRAAHSGIQHEEPQQPEDVRQHPAFEAQPEAHTFAVEQGTAEHDLSQADQTAFAESEYGHTDDQSASSISDVGSDPGWDNTAAQEAAIPEYSDASDRDIPTFEPSHSVDAQVSDVEIEKSSFDFRSQFDAAPEYVPENSYHDSTAQNEFIAEPVSEKIVELEQPEFLPSDGSTVEGPADWPVPIVADESFAETTELEAVSTSAPAMVFDDSRPSFEPSEHVAETTNSPVEGVPSFGDHTVSSHAALADVHGVESETIDDVSSGFDTVPQPNGGFAPQTSPAMEQPAVARVSGTRLSDRNVDLPIEVADDERRLHNDARRFARLLVSEIKLYNEKKVQEGREANDLYERLREAIDRSREMYDKRVQPPVASKFDYFHYELVNSLAGGAVEKLGQSYKGAAV